MIAAFLAVGAIIALALFLSGKSGNLVQVRVDGTVIREFSLSEDVVWDIPGVNGGSNKLIIEDGQARIEEASCPDGLCVHMGRISKTGQSVICLPNRVVIEIIADHEKQVKPELDYVVG